MVKNGTKSQKFKKRAKSETIKNHKVLRRNEHYVNSIKKRNNL